LTSGAIKISEEELRKALAAAEEREKRDPKKRWVQRMIRSAKLHHKICPYYDKKKGTCFKLLGGKCVREGRFENCPVFIQFLERKYDEIVALGKPLPVDFEDPLIQFG